MRSRRFLALLALTQALPQFALAQGDCLDNTGHPNVQYSRVWEQLGQRHNAQKMKALEGSYLILSDTIKIATLGPDGAYQFTEQVCSQTPCKTVNKGQGTYRAAPGTGGGTFFMIRFSDAERTNVCETHQVESETEQVFVMENGETWIKWKR